MTNYFCITVFGTLLKIWHFIIMCYLMLFIVFCLLFNLLSRGREIKRDRKRHWEKEREIEKDRKRHGEREIERDRKRYIDV